MSRTPATLMRRAPQSEIGLHMQVAAFLRHAWPEHLLWTHFPAGERRDAKTGAKLKAMGLAPGWPDFILILPNAQLAALELKVIGGVLSLVQMDVRDRFLALGCGYAVCRSLDEVERVLSGWLALFNLKLRATTGVRA